MVSILQSFVVQLGEEEVWVGESKAWQLTHAVAGGGAEMVVAVPIAGVYWWYMKLSWSVSRWRTFFFLFSHMRLVNGTFLPETTVEIERGAS